MVHEVRMGVLPVVIGPGTRFFGAVHPQHRTAGDEGLRPHL
ncbi:hypothetical protein [Brachybacterium sacelli]|uniref:Uncharacterized protein n=1 Tax=Brachybacterium sacelli TaxID=173364 RepID=A0ABS4X2E0_9MICO|nr:hypothetical protein [Brachybacterium sacelli]MBP2382615.1 hypothetical protein [Brachybacterium sacelli]